MPKFTDNKNRTWVVAINIPLAKRIRTELEFPEFLDLEKALTRFATEPILLYDTLWILCQAQASKKNVTEEDFGLSFSGQAIQEGGDAIVDALLDFSPPRQREVLSNLRTISDRYQTSMAGLIGKAKENLNSMFGSSSASLKELSDTSPPEPSET